MELLVYKSEQEREKAVQQLVALIVSSSNVYFNFD